MQKCIVLLTKDAMCKDYLPIYGNKLWKTKTPNLDNEVNNGTIFYNCYTAAPSTAMAFLGLCTGRFSYELENKKYEHIKDKYKDTIFSVAKNRGYVSHIIWDSRWLYLAKPYSECYEDAIFHCIEGLGQPVGSQFPHAGDLIASAEKTQAVLDKLSGTLDEISQLQDNIFLWIHLPHVINGRTGYGSDIDIFDKIIGLVREHFKECKLFISADHGNMNGHKNKVGYGFDVYNPAIQIPLITPRVEGQTRYDDNFSIIDFCQLIFDGKIKKRKYIYCDSAYYAQVHRKLAIIRNEYKYIYNKENRTEELYDLKTDPLEQCNLINDRVYDTDRHIYAPLKELYYLTNWEEIDKMRNELRTEKMRIWREEGKLQGLFMRLKRKFGILYTKLKVGIKKAKNL